MTLVILDNKLLDELNNKPPEGIGVKEDKDTQRHEPPIPQEPDDDDKVRNILCNP